MKPLKLSFALILLGLALLLCGASNVQKETTTLPTASKQKKEPENKTTVTQKSPTAPAIPLVIYADPATQPKEATSKNESQNWYDWFWPPIWSSWALVIMGVIAAYIALRTVRAVDHQTQAIFDGTVANRIAAEAAMDSVKAAQLALHADRPFLVMDNPNLVGFHPPSNISDLPMSGEQLTASFRLRNCGKGPAVIEEAKGRLTVAREYPGIGKFADCSQMEVMRSAFAAGESSDRVSPRRDARVLSLEQYESVRNGDDAIIFYGQIAYRDIFSERYTTTFLYTYWPPPDYLPESLGTMQRGPEEYNRYT